MKNEVKFISSKRSVFVVILAACLFVWSAARSVYAAPSQEDVVREKVEVSVVESVSYTHLTLPTKA